MTDYAEGELFQILEDDGSLPEDQVSIMKVAMPCLLAGWRKQDLCACRQRVSAVSQEMSGG